MSLCAGEERVQGIPTVLLRSQFSAGCQSGAGVGGLECDGPISVALYQNLEKYSGIFDYCCGLQRGVGGNKLQINPTYLTHPTQAILHKALRFMAGVGYVEYVGLRGDFWGRCS
jgi:hypothetical protein